MDTVLLNIDGNGASTTYLGNMLQCLTLMVKIFFPYVQSEYPLVQLGKLCSETGVNDHQLNYVLIWSMYIYALNIHVLIFLSM